MYLYPKLPNFTPRRSEEPQLETTPLSVWQVLELLVLYRYSGLVTVTWIIILYWVALHRGYIVERHSWFSPGFLLVLYTL